MCLEGMCVVWDGVHVIAGSTTKERQGPKLPTENLLLRGEEIKFLNSLS